MCEKRESAKALGLKRYFDGVRCCNGHIAEKYVCSGACLECLRESGKRWREANREKDALKQKEFRWRHAERLKAERMARSSAMPKRGKAARPSLVLPDAHCETCGTHIPRRINKDGSHSKLVAKYCSVACKPRGSVELWCMHCGQHTIRHTSGGDDKKYCSRKCVEDRRSTLSMERAALMRMGEEWRKRSAEAKRGMLRDEVAGIRRLGKLQSKCITVRQCSQGCGNKAIGLGEYKRNCHACTKIIKAKAKRSEARLAGKRKYKAARRAIVRGIEADRIDPIQVLEADGWRCYICGVDTPRELRGTYEPNAPEVDHVIPLAAGGLHVLSNLRCACRACNGAKGAKTIGG